jgi:hypothetical protein
MVYIGPPNARNKEISDVDNTVTFVATQRLSEQVPSEMNTHATIEELPFLCDGEVNTPL